MTLSHPRSRPHPRRSCRGFTLIELLIVVAITLVLIAILLPALSGVRRAARKAREVHAAGQLMNAHTMYSNDNNGRLVPGYDRSAVAYDRHNEPITPAVAGHRYPWRLAPYLSYNLHDSILVNQQSLQVKAAEQDGEDTRYLVSVFPSFGINAIYVGGHDDFITWVPHLKKIDNARHPAMLITFATARGPVFSPGDDPYGYFEVRPPMTPTYLEDEMPFRFGFVHLRHDGKAVTAMLDGHSEEMDETQLFDIRHWSDRAAATGSAF